MNTRTTETRDKHTQDKNRNDESTMAAGTADDPASTAHLKAKRGSGHDLNSDIDRLQDPENLQDKVEEDTFPASDPPSFSPMTGVGPAQDDNLEVENASTRAGLPADFKDNGAAQFEYGRKSQRATHHFDQQSRRLENGNPDIGEVDLGTIEADRPAQPDDSDHMDSPDDI